MNINDAKCAKFEIINDPMWCVCELVCVCACKGKEATTIQHNYKVI